MRFRASISNVQTFYRIIQAIEKLQKKFLIKFTETSMHIICNSDANEGGIQVWSQIKATSLFSSYRIQSNAQNEITLSLSSEALLAALRSSMASVSSSTSNMPTSADHQNAEQSVTTVVKLAKKNANAVLTFDISSISRVGGHQLRISHDVRIEVLKPGDVARLGEPLCPEPDVHVLLPPLQKLRTIVERMKPMSDVIALRANNNGRLQLSICTEGVKVETEWKGCTNPKAQDVESSQREADDEEEKDPDEIFSVLVSVKSFLKFLNSHVVSTTTIACICQNHCVILYVYIGDVADAGGVLTFYIPAIIDDE